MITLISATWGFKSSHRGTTLRRNGGLKSVRNDPRSSRPEDRKDRLQLAKKMGVNTITFYVGWWLHEPEDGTFDFTSPDRDVAEFVRTIHETGPSSAYSHPVRSFHTSGVAATVPPCCLHGAAVRKSPRHSGRAGP